jgi:hypothetical protein
MICDCGCRVSHPEYTNEGHYEVCAKCGAKSKLYPDVKGMVSYNTTQGSSMIFDNQRPLFSDRHSVNHFAYGQERTSY